MENNEAIKELADAVRDLSYSVRMLAIGCEPQGADDDDEDDDPAAHIIGRAGGAK